MGKIVVVYGSTLGNTKSVANLIAKCFEPNKIDVLNVAETNPEVLNQYDKLIFGTSTWGIGELQSDWEEFNFKDLKVENKTVAVFGMGDSEVYAFTYCDSIAKMHKILKSKKANIVGYVPSKDYKFTKSEAVENDHFLGLALDNDNFEDLTESRVKAWVELIKPHFID